MVQRTAKFWLVAGALVFAASVLFGACVSQKSAPAAKKEDRGIKFSHATHKDLGCTDCHALKDTQASIPTHDQCGTCHEIDMDKPDEKACAFCHTRPGLEILPVKRVLKEEVKFSHTTHDAAKVECGTCHPNPDKMVLPTTALMSFCVDCHGKKSATLNECNVCHSQISRDTVPQYRGTTRIQHDAPTIWEHVHGQESRVNLAFCTLCHDQQKSCDSCHQENPPSSHTISWRRKTHGLQATWDRNKCAACHEEDSCRKCHKHSAPESHRAGWAGITNTHCVQCHFPPQETKCTVCHEDIDHERAIRSPHDLGIFPPRCGLCHPGGNPYRAPHLTNSTVRCGWCH